VRGIEVREVASLRELRRFVSFQYLLYENDRHWVPPPRAEELRSLRKDKNPAFAMCEAKYWLALKDGKIVGRIAGIINRRYNEKWNEHAARFGWFDFVDDREASRKLMEQVEHWAAEQGMHHIHGPLGFTDMDGEGMLVEGFEEIGTLGALYNYPYYQTHIEGLGYSKDVDWVEYEITMHDVIPERIARAAGIALERNGLTVLKARKAREVLPYAKKIFRVLNEAYKDLYGFVELSEDQIALYVKQYFGFVNPDFVPVVLDANDDVVAFGIAMPSLSVALQRCRGRLFPFGWVHVLRALKSPRGLDLYLTAVRPEMQNKGINAIVIHEINKALSKYGIARVETNRELESNAKVRAQWKDYDSRQHKRRRCYKKDLRAAT
jgi:GNAT superfamily N-acetyltransferase